MNKICVVCKLEFHLKEGNFKTCSKECALLLLKETRKRNNSKENKARRNDPSYRKRYPKSARDHDIRRSYNISANTYDGKLKSQNNVCALCGEDFYGEGHNYGAPALDHDHDTKVLREFIHSKCNIAIGLLGDSIDKCLLAAEYLKKHLEIKNVSEQDRPI